MTAYVPPYSASLSDWQRQVSAAVNPLLRRANDVADVKVDYGALGDGASDDTAAFNKAASAGVSLFLPDGTYILSSAIQCSTAGFSVSTAGKGRVTLIQSAVGQPVFNVSANNVVLRGMSLGYSGTPTSGSTAAIIGNGQYCRYESIQITSCYNGFLFSQSPFQTATDVEVLNYINAGIKITAVNDIAVSQFVLNAGNSTNGASGGIWLQDRCEAVMLTDGEILNGVYPMKMDASVNSSGNRPAYNRCVDVYFDSSTNGVLINNSVDLDFTGCWFSSRPNDGIVLTNTDGVRFTGGGALNCGTNGVRVGSGAVRTIFEGFTARGNSVTSSNTADGIYITAGVTDFVVKGCILGGALGFGSQRYGVNVNTGASDRYIVADNLVSGNSTGGVADNGTGTNKRVANNY